MKSFRSLSPPSSFCKNLLIAISAYLLCGWKIYSLICDSLKKYMNHVVFQVGNVTFQGLWYSWKYFRFVRCLRNPKPLDAILSLGLSVFQCLFMVYVKRQDYWSDQEAPYRRNREQTIILCMLILLKWRILTPRSLVCGWTMVNYRPLFTWFWMNEILRETYFAHHIVF